MRHVTCREVVLLVRGVLKGESAATLAFVGRLTHLDILAYTDEMTATTLQDRLLKANLPG